MSKPVLLDLFCCEGIGARGYIAAGFDVIGADMTGRFKKRYPGEFFEGDWLEALGKYADKVDAIHASPPCQGYSIATSSSPEVRDRYPRLIPVVREALMQTGKPWVIENVPGARPEMIDPVTLCGSHFGLSATDEDGTRLVLRRHRLFESSVSIPQPECRHGRDEVVGGVYGGASTDRYRAKYVRKGGYTPAKHVREELIVVPAGAHTLHGLSQSLPPAYTEHVGRALLTALDALA